MVVTWYGEYSEMLNFLRKRGRKWHRYVWKGIPQKRPTLILRESLGGRFGYFLFFSARGRGRGSPGRPGG